MGKVLVAYGSKYGSTAEIAEKIGQVFKNAGIGTEVLDVRKVRSLKEYDAVVLGSGVYIGKWLKPASVFIAKNEKVLSEKHHVDPEGQGTVFHGQLQCRQVQEIRV